MQDFSARNRNFLSTRVGTEVTAVLGCQALEKNKLIFPDDSPYKCARGICGSIKIGGISDEEYYARSSVAWRRRVARANGLTSEYVHARPDQVRTTAAFRCARSAVGGNRRRSNGEFRRLYHPPQDAQWLQDRASLASQARKCDGDFRQLQSRHGRQVRSGQNDDFPRRQLRLSRSRHASLCDGIRRSGRAGPWHVAAAI